MKHHKECICFSELSLVYISDFISNDLKYLEPKSQTGVWNLEWGESV